MSLSLDGEEMIQPLYCLTEKRNLGESMSLVDDYGYLTSLL